MDPTIEEKLDKIAASILGDLRTISQHNICVCKLKVAIEYFKENLSPLDIFEREDFEKIEPLDIFPPEAFDAMREKWMAEGAAQERETTPEDRRYLEEE